MMCPFCGADTRVIDTRGTRRRRECFDMHRFSTEEQYVPDRVEGAVKMVLAGVPRRKALEEHGIYHTSLRRGLRAAGVDPLPIGRPKRK